MIAKQLFTCLLCSISFLPCLTAQDSPAGQLKFLQKNIRVWVLHQPNTEKLDFYRVQPLGVYMDTDGIIMGKSTNNGMNVSAKLLSALFKDPEKGSNKGDMALQHLAYYLLKNLDKPIDLYFVNDSRETIEDKYLAPLSIYTRSTAENENTVHSAVYMPGAGNDSSSGKIVLGELLDMNAAKGSLIRCMSFLSLKHFEYLKPTAVYSFQNATPPALMYQQKQLNTTYPDADIRTTVFNAIAISLMLEGGVYASREKEYYDKWLLAGPYLQVRMNNYYEYLKGLIPETVPEKYLLNTQLKKSKTYSRDTGFVNTNPPFDLDPTQLHLWKVYDFKNLDNQNKVSNEFVLALILKKYIDHNFSAFFIESLGYKDKRLEKAPQEKQFIYLIENLCMYGMDEDMPIGDRTDKIHFYTLALMDMLLDFPIEIVDNNFISARTFFGVFPENSFSPELLKAYFKLRPAIKEAAKKANKKPALSILYSGYDNVTRMSNSIWEYLKAN